MAFHVGQKVVCVRAGRPFPNETDAQVGGVYTVRAIHTYELFGTAIWVDEIANPIVSTCVGKLERGFSAKRFRPVIERKTDISIFTEILNSVNSKEPVS